MCAVLYGGGVIWIFQDSGRKFGMKSSIYLFTIIFSFSRKDIFPSEIHVFRSDQFSFLMYRCLFPSSATVKRNYEENMENASYATNDVTPL
jgi:hypothetical protein